MKQVEYSYHFEMYMGHICRAEGDLTAAMDWWRRMTEHSPEKAQVWHEMGSIHAKLGRYEEAVGFYQKAIPMWKRPRFTDCQDAISQIYEIQGNIPGAIEMQKELRQIILEDWTTEGEAVDAIDREIARLENLK